MRKPLTLPVFFEPACTCALERGHRHQSTALSSHGSSQRQTHPQQLELVKMEGVRCGKHRNPSLTDSASVVTQLFAGLKTMDLGFKRKSQLFQLKSYKGSRMPCYSVGLEIALHSSRTALLRSVPKLLSHMPDFQTLLAGPIAVSAVISRMRLFALLCQIRFDGLFAQ